MQQTVQKIIRALTCRKPYLLGNRRYKTVASKPYQATVQKTVGSKPAVKNRREVTVQETVQKTVQPTIRLVIDLETGTVKVKL